MLEVNLMNKKETTIVGLFQWDYGQIVKVIGIAETDDLEIHIGNDSSETYMVKSIAIGNGYLTFQIPDSLLQASKTIKAIIYYDSGTEGKSKKVINFQVKARIKPEDYITPDDENYKYVVPKGGTTGQVLVKKSDADGDTDWSDVGGVSSFNINSLTEENDLADGDYLALYDTSATAHRKTLWSNIKAKLKAYFDTLYSAIGHTHTKSSITDFDDSDYASAEHTHDDRYYTEAEIDTKLSTKSDITHNHSGVYQPVETGKGLSTNDLTDTLKGNYDSAYNHSQQTHAPSNAEANVQSDWNQADTGADDYIKNKPTIPESYTLPVASATALGGVMPVSKTDDMTQDVGVDANGKLYTAPGSGGSSGGGLSDMELITEIDFSQTTNAAFEITNLENLTEIYIKYEAVTNGSTASQYNLYINGTTILDCAVKIGGSNSLYGWANARYNGIAWIPQGASGAVSGTNIQGQNINALFPFNTLTNVGKATNFKLVMGNPSYKATSGTAKIYGR